MIPLLSWLALLGTAAAGEPVSYAIDAPASTLFVIVLRDPATLAATLAHDHAIGATGWSGTVVWDPADPAACRVAVTVPVAGLRVDPPGYRAKAGIDLGGVSASDKAKISANFWAPNQLDRARFSEIRFESTTCTGRGGRYVVNGEMTLRGRVRTTAIEMNVSADGRTLKASGRFQARQTDWRFQPYSAFLGAIRNKDELTFVIDVTAYAIGA